ncbi:DgyrCDS9697 [Dimorphilus gyrociliatus]|uniref:DgyrCDS9697 n=1 Tax=Dimorphilus gyrociliatus TaxID=2664684 RepID=A0A7I8VZX7_9ANNE|nr:DgyrCDS9697 [Dimorphilus gyrociliatus]
MYTANLGHDFRETFITSPKINFDSNKPLRLCLQFHHMIDHADNNLFVILLNKGRIVEKTLIVGRQNPNKQWTKSTLETFKKFDQVIFQVRRLKGILGITAIDDIQINDCRGDFGTIKPTEIPVYYPPQYLNCNFEPGFCTWNRLKYPESEYNSYEWGLHQGSTHSLFTGPTNDHTYGNKTGKYAYVEASLSKKGHFAELVSPYFSLNNNNYCVKLYYHMFGSSNSIGKLQIFGYYDGLDTIKYYETSANLGNEWHKLAFDLKPFHNVHQIVIRATSQGDYRGDIAIDDISVHSGSCKDNSQVASSPEQLTCNFERDFGLWSVLKNPNSPSNKFEWTRHYGSTPSLGPKSDSQGGNGWYIYVDARYNQFGYSTQLKSPIFNLNNKDYCLETSLYMSGSQNEIGEFEILSSRRGLLKASLYRKSENMGNKWNNIYIPLKSTDDIDQIIITARSRGAGKGDIALDNVKVTEGNCPYIS